MVEEIQKAQTAVEQEVTLFDRIVQKKIPANIIYEDDIVRLQSRAKNNHRL